MQLRIISSSISNEVNALLYILSTITGVLLVRPTTGTPTDSCIALLENTYIANALGIILHPVFFSIFGYLSV